jgi:hypothetical protein
VIAGSNDRMEKHIEGAKPIEAGRGFLFSKPDERIFAPVCFQSDFVDVPAPGLLIPGPSPLAAAF